MTADEVRKYINQVAFQARMIFWKNMRIRRTAKI